MPFASYMVIHLLLVFISHAWIAMHTHTHTHTNKPKGINCTFSA